MAGACITVRVPASLALLRTISAQTANAATIDFVLPSRAEQGHIPLIFASKQLQCPGSARLAANSQSIKPNPPCHAGARSESDGFEDVRAASDASVDDQFGSAVQLLRNLPDHVETDHSGIHLPPAMVGQTKHTQIGRATCWDREGQKGKI